MLSYLVLKKRFKIFKRPRFVSRTHPCPADSLWNPVQVNDKYIKCPFHRKCIPHLTFLISCNKIMMHFKLAVLIVDNIKTTVNWYLCQLGSRIIYLQYLKNEVFHMIIVIQNFTLMYNNIGGIAPICIQTVDFYFFFSIIVEYNTQVEIFVYKVNVQKHFAVWKSGDFRTFPLENITILLLIMSFSCATVRRYDIQCCHVVKKNCPSCAIYCGELP